MLPRVVPHAPILIIGLALSLAVGGDAARAAGQPNTRDQHSEVQRPERQWWAGTLNLPGPQGPIPVGVVVSLAPAANPADAGPGGSETEVWGASLDLVPGPGTTGASAIACTDVRVTPTEISFSAPPPIMTTFRLSRPAAGATSASGEATIQGLGEVAVTMELVSEAAARSRIIPRPQTPRPPFPYAQEDITITSSVDGLALAGTLTRPDSAGPHPVAVLVSDAGAQDRDHAEVHHRPFLVLADHLTRRGIAVLRLDDRGTGGSAGLYMDATLDTKAADLRSAVAAMAQRQDIDADRIGVIGLGDGALVGAMAAAEDPAVRWLALLSPAGLPGKEVSLLRERRRMEAEGEDPAFIEAQIARSRTVLDLVTKGTDQETIAAAIGEVILGAARDLRGDGVTPEDWQVQETASQQAFLYSSPAMRQWLTLDPAGPLQQLGIPVLVVAGGLDLIIPTEDNLPNVEAALKSSGAEVTMHRFPGLNHSLQPATTGFADEVASIPTTIDPAALDAIAAWIESQSEPKP